MADLKLSNDGPVSGFWHLTPLSCSRLWMHGPTTLISSHKHFHQPPNTFHHCCLAWQAQNQAATTRFQVFQPPTPSLTLCLQTHMSGGNRSCSRSPRSVAVAMVAADILPLLMPLFIYLFWSTSHSATNPLGVPGTPQGLGRDLGVNTFVTMLTKRLIHSPTGRQRESPC